MIESIPQEELERDKNTKFLLIRGSIAAGTGAVLLIWPGLGLNLLALIMGLFLLADGIYGLYNSYRKKSDTPRITWIMRIVQCLLAILFIVRPGWIVSLGIRFLFVVSGVIVVGFVFFSTFIIPAQERKIKVGQIIYLLLGLILIFAPFFSAQLFVRMIGGMILIFSVSDVVTLLRVRKKPLNPS